MLNIYSTSQIADKFDLHSNTIRLYEKLGFISMPKRKANGYRIYTERHVKEMEVARLALRAEVLQNGLRKKAIQIIKTVAKGQIDTAAELTDEYLLSINNEIMLAVSAIKITEGILSNQPIEANDIFYTRKKAAEILHITIDTLRNWEFNGLIKVKRKKNGYRIYNDADMQILRIIRELRVTNYSLSAILRMLSVLEYSTNINLQQILNTPSDGEFIISVCDRLIVSLNQLKLDAIELKKKILSLK